MINYLSVIQVQKSVFEYIVYDSEVEREFARKLMAMPNVLSVTFDRVDPNRVEIETAAPDVFYTEVAEMVLAEKLEFTAFTSPDNNLESVFRYLVAG